MKRHIASLMFCLCIVMQLSAFHQPGIPPRGFIHSNQDGDMPIVYPGWRDNIPAKKAPERTPKPAKVPVVQQLVPDLPDDADEEPGDRAHIVYNKGTEKDGTAVTIDLEPQETKALLNAVSPALKITGAVCGVAVVCAIASYGYLWWKKNS